MFPPFGLGVERDIFVEPGKYNVKDEVFMCRQYGKELAIKLCWQHGMQVKDLAELFGVSRNTIGNWVNDSRPKPDDT